MIIHNGTLHQGDIPLNRSFRYGDGLFETIRVYEGHLLFWKDHMERLEKGMKQLKFEFRPQLFQLLLQENARLLLKELAINKHGRLRIHVYRSGRGAYSPINRDPSFVIEAYSFDADTYESLHPVSMVSFKDYPLTIGPATGIKSANSLPLSCACIAAMIKAWMNHSCLTKKELSVKPVLQISFTSRRKSYSRQIYLVCVCQES
ncbi:MAG: aminotransferase class IV [Bacteroidota bacterium]